MGKEITIWRRRAALIWCLFLLLLLLTTTAKCPLDLLFAFSLGRQLRTAFRYENGTLVQNPLVNLSDDHNPCRATTLTLIGADARQRKPGDFPDTQFPKTQKSKRRADSCFS